MTKPVPRAWSRPTLSLLLGSLVVLACLELGLRVLGAWQREEPETVAAGERVVLTIGDSYTRCPGVAASASYPSQLQGLLDEAWGPGTLKVVNRSRNGMNTTAMLAELDEELARYQPEAVVLLIGGANEWNHAGMRNLQQAPSAMDRMEEALTGLRTVKLAVLAARTLRPGGAEGTRVVAPQARPPGPPEPEANPEGSRGPHREPSREGPPELPAPLCGEDAPELFDQLNKLQQQQRYEESEALLIAAEQAHPECPSLPGLRGLLMLELGNHAEAEAALELALELEPDDPRHHDHLGRALHQQGRRLEAVRVMVRGLAVPDTPWTEAEKDRLLMHLLAICEDPEGAAIAEAQRAFDELSPDHPRLLPYRELLERALEGRSEVATWAMTDIEQAIATIRGSGAEIVLMNYPLDHPRDWWQEYQRLADEQRLPFVDNRGAFRRLRDPGAYFLSDGHLNERGNAELAANVQRELQRLLPPQEAL